MEKYYNKVSFKSKIINFLFTFTKSKKIFSDITKTKEYIVKLQKKKNYNLPKKMGMTLDNVIEKNGKKLYVYSYNRIFENKVLIYIHGGSYIEEAISYQIKFAMKIAKNTNSTLIMPIYPLAPNANYKNMYELIDEMYSNIVNKYEQINFLGDSAGGGFSLSYAMYLKDKKLNQPQNILMLSPWLDVTMTNSELLISEKRDRLSGIIGNKYAGELWADGLDLKNYLISPLYGNFDNLGRITIVTGENDILKPDCLKLHEKLEKLNIDHFYIEYKAQCHDFGAYPTEEGKMVINDLSIIINKGELK